MRKLLLLVLFVLTSCSSPTQLELIYVGDIQHPCTREEREASQSNLDFLVLKCTDARLTALCDFELGECGQAQSEYCTEWIHRRERAAKQDIESCMLENELLGWKPHTN